MSPIFATVALLLIFVSQPLIAEEEYEVEVVVGGARSRLIFGGVESLQAVPNATISILDSSRNELASFKVGDDGKGTFQLDENTVKFVLAADKEGYRSIEFQVDPSNCSSPIRVELEPSIWSPSAAHTYGWQTAGGVVWSTPGNAGCTTCISSQIIFNQIPNSSQYFQGQIIFNGPFVPQQIQYGTMPVFESNGVLSIDGIAPNQITPVTSGSNGTSPNK
ncbi:MAG: hypothetical protein R3C03_09395 [Pirellulaceae bacterium]